MCREEDAGQQSQNDDEYSRNVAKCVTLSIAYSANIGGIGSLMGTGTNILFKGQLDMYVNTTTT